MNVIDFSDISDPDKALVIDEMIKALKILKKNKTQSTIVLAVGCVNGAGTADYEAITYGSLDQVVGLLGIIKYKQLRECEDYFEYADDDGEGDDDETD